jgi:hypothetical protein
VKRFWSIRLDLACPEYVRYPVRLGPASSTLRGFIDAVSKINSNPMRPRSAFKAIDRDSEFAVQLDAIQFWDRFDG